MSEAAPPTSVEDAERELDVVTARIETTESYREALYDRRRALFAYLLAQKVPQARIARRARVTPMAVSLAVGKAARAAAKNGGGPVKKAPARKARKATSATR